MFLDWEGKTVFNFTFKVHRKKKGSYSSAGASFTPSPAGNFILFHFLSAHSNSTGVRASKSGLSSLSQRDA
jgi:hypothetical protein